MLHVYVRAPRKSKNLRVHFTPTEAVINPATVIIRQKSSKFKLSSFPNFAYLRQQHHQRDHDPEMILIIVKNSRTGHHCQQKQSTRPVKKYALRTQSELGGHFVCQGRTHFTPSRLILTKTTMAIRTQVTMLQHRYRWQLQRLLRLGM